MGFKAAFISDKYLHDPKSEDFPRMANYGDISSSPVPGVEHGLWTLVQALHDIFDCRGAFLLVQLHFPLLPTVAEFAE